TEACDGNEGKTPQDQETLNQAGHAVDRVGGEYGEDGGEIDWADESTPDPARAHGGREAWARLAGALRELPARQREAFTLRVLEDMDVETTAKIMGCSEGSVKTHLFRAREALQKQLEEFR